MKSITVENVAGRPLISAPKVNGRHPPLENKSRRLIARARNKHIAHGEIVLSVGIIGRGGECYYGSGEIFLELLLHRAVNINILPRVRSGRAA